MFAGCCCAPQILAQDSRYDKLADAPFPGGYPAKESLSPLEKELLFQEASQSYICSLPAVNMWAMKEGSEKVFGAGYNVLPYWPKRLTAPRALVTTLNNSDVIYSTSYLDLKDGPLVVEAPQGVQGLFDDFWQRPLSGRPLTVTRGLAMSVWPAPTGARVEDIFRCRRITKAKFQQMVSSIARALTMCSCFPPRPSADPNDLSKADDTI